MKRVIKASVEDQQTAHMDLMQAVVEILESQIDLQDVKIDTWHSSFWALNPSDTREKVFVEVEEPDLLTVGGAEFEFTITFGKRMEKGPYAYSGIERAANYAANEIYNTVWDMFEDSEYSNYIVKNTKFN